MKKINKTKLDDIRRESLYDDLIGRVAESAVVWEGLPEELTSELMERAINCGVAVVYKVPEGSGSCNKGLYTCTPLEWVGRLRNDGTSDRWITHGTDYSITSEQLEGKAVIIKNNFRMSSEYENFDRFSDTFVDIDKAEKSLIRWCRINPIALVPSTVDANQLITVLTDVYEGRKPFGVVSDNTKIVTGQPKSAYDNVLNLVDVSAVEKMHFLSEYRYDVLRRICNLYNIPFHENAKSAQSLESELHNTDIFSQILPQERMLSRERALPDFKAVFGWDVSVHESEWVKNENKVIEQTIEEETQDVKEETEENTDTNTDATA